MPTVICGDINASTHRIPTLQQMLDQCEWHDCGLRADAWGDEPETCTCQATSTANPTRIGYFIVNVMFPASRGHQAATTDVFKKHQPLQLLVDTGEMIFFAALEDSNGVASKVSSTTTTVLSAAPKEKCWATAVPLLLSLPVAACPAASFSVFVAAGLSCSCSSLLSLVFMYPARRPACN